MKTLEKGLKAFIAIVLIFLVGWVAGSAYFGTMDFGKWGGTQLSQINSNPNPLGLGAPTSFNVHVSAYDTQDPTASLTATTNYYVYWYTNNNGAWQRLGVDTTTINVPTGSSLYAQVVVPNGQSYYVDQISTQSKNPRCTGWQFVDINDGLAKQFLFAVNLNGIQPIIGANPDFYFYPYLYAYQKPSLNEPSNVTGVGATTTAEYIQWQASFSSTKKAWQVAEIQIQINTTSIAKVTLDQINVPGVGYISGSQFGAPVQGSSTLTWSDVIGLDHSTAAVMALGNNALNSFPLTTEIHVTLSSGNKIGVTITIYGLTAAGAMTDSITNTVCFAYS